MLRIATLLLLAMLAAAPSATGLTVSGDGRHLLDDGGDPVYLNGATPWHILARLDRDESLRYLDSRRSMGFDALLLSILVNDDFRTGSFDNAYGDPPFRSEYDFSRPNEDYFRHVDWFFEQATARGMTLLVEPAYLGWGCDREGFCQAMQEAGPETMRAYGRWIGERYRHLDNLVWVNGGDADAAAHGAAAVVDAVAEGIAEVSPEQLQSAHCDRGQSAVDCYDRPWLDLNNTYSDCSATPARLLADFGRGRPFFFIEGYYEGEHETGGVCLRSQAYWSFLGGALGHFFGNRPMWDFWPGWQEALDSEGSWSMRYFGSLVHSRDWSRLEPDWNHHVLVAGYGSLEDGSHAAAARTHDGSTVLVYTPERRALTVDLGAIAGESAVAWWYNPSNGTSVFIGTLPATGPQTFTPPFGGDWVLVLDDESLELPAPGEGRGVELRSQGEVKARYRRRR